MTPEEINLETIDKLFEYEKHCRFIDKLEIDELRSFSKLYCKLYLRQQEVLASISEVEI